MLKMASFLTELPEWTQPPKPLQDGTDLIYYKSIVICLFGLFQETIELVRSQYDPHPLDIRPYCILFYHLNKLPDKAWTPG